ncbi:hypothetical protein Prudu_018813, partial [Prunus dulcis]
MKKRKRIIPKWKIIEAVNWFQKLGTDNRTEDVRPNEGDSHDDLVNLLKLCWEWRQDPNLVMQFGNVEAEIEFFASLVKADGWLKGDNHISTCFAENKRKKQQVGWKIRKSLLNVVNGKVPPCGMDWQNVYKVYTPFMLTKYKHWVAVMIDLVLCEIKVYDSKVSLIPDDIVKEELARYQLRFQIFSTPSTFMKKRSASVSYLHLAQHAFFSVEIGCGDNKGRCLLPMILVEDDK